MAGLQQFSSERSEQSVVPSHRVSDDTHCPSVQMNSRDVHVLVDCAAAVTTLHNSRNHEKETQKRNNNSTTLTLQRPTRDENAQY